MIEEGLARKSEPAALTIGQLIELAVPRDGDMERYPSRVEAIEGAVVHVAAPMRQLAVVRVPRGARVYLSAARNGDARYRIASLVLEQRNGQFPMLVLQVGDEWEREQLRRDVRISCDLRPVRVWLAEDGQQVEIRTRIQNLSAGGVAVTTREPLRVGQVVNLQLRLPGDDALLELRARVVRLLEARSPGDLGKLSGWAFVDIAPRDHDRIVRFIFRVQLERRRRGLE